MGEVYTARDTRQALQIGAVALVSKPRAGME
jgi:hypothetical protein